MLRSFENILRSLEKNYTIQKIPNNEILFCWNIKRSVFIKDSIIYKNGLKNFYEQKTSFIKYLLNNKSSNTEFNNWVITKNPCSSNFKNIDFITNSKGVIILIDNLLNNETKINITINEYIDKIKIMELKKFIVENEDINFEEMKKKYKQFIKNTDQ